MRKFACESPFHQRFGPATEDALTGLRSVMILLAKLANYFFMESFSTVKLCEVLAWSFLSLLNINLTRIERLLLISRYILCDF